MYKYLIFLLFFVPSVVHADNAITWLSKSSYRLDSGYSFNNQYLNNTCFDNPSSAQLPKTYTISGIGAGDGDIVTLTQSQSGACAGSFNSLSYALANGDTLAVPFDEFNVQLDYLSELCFTESGLCAVAPTPVSTTTSSIDQSQQNLGIAYLLFLASMTIMIWLIRKH